MKHDSIFQFTGSLEDAIRIASARLDEHGMGQQQSDAKKDDKIEDGVSYRRSSYRLPEPILSAVRAYVAQRHGWSAKRVRIDYLLHNGRRIYVQIQDLEGVGHHLGGTSRFAIEIDEASAQILAELSML